MGKIEKRLEGGRDHKRERQRRVRIRIDMEGAGKEISQTVVHPTNKRTP